VPRPAEFPGDDHTRDGTPQFQSFESVLQQFALLSQAFGFQSTQLSLARFPRGQVAIFGFQRPLQIGECPFELTPNFPTIQPSQRLTNLHGFSRIDEDLEQATFKRGSHIPADDRLQLAIASDPIGNRVRHDPRQCHAPQAEQEQRATA
jgi:hypothetical protein